MLKNVQRFFLLIAFVSLAESAQSQAEDNLGSWFIYNGFFYLNPNWELFFETQLRLYEPVSNAETWFLRPYLMHHFSKQFHLGVGLEYHASWNYVEMDEEKVRTDEIRLTLQGFLFNFIDRTTIQHRYRLEQRWFETGNRQRTRYRIQATIPLNKTKMEKGTFFVNTFNEFLIDIGPELAFAQNRIYLAPGYQFSKHLNLQVGYLLISKPQHNLSRMQFFLTHKLWMYDKEG
jgi:hypothetical protein